MTLEEQMRFFEAFTVQMKLLLFRKGNDYSSKEDRLSNFKFSGNITGLTGEQSCLNLIAVKIARLGQLLKADRIPNNESIDDTVIDLANYAVLLAMLIEDTRNKPVTLDELEEGGKK